MSHSGFSHREFLQSAGQVLAAEGFGNQLLPASDEVPYDVLAVVVGEPPENAFQLELSFLPNLESTLEGAHLLQCFAALPVETIDGKEVDLVELVVKLNSKLPLVGFGWLEAERLLFFRHVLMVPDDRMQGLRLLKQTSWMISYLLSLFGGRLAEVASGQREPIEALDGHPYEAVFKS